MSKKIFMTDPEVEDLKEKILSLEEELAEAYECIRDLRSELFYFKERCGDEY